MVSFNDLDDMCHLQHFIELASDTAFVVMLLRAGRSIDHRSKV